MSGDFDRLLALYALQVSQSKNNKKMTRKRHYAAERQGWRCCYCGVPMFAGHPTEDIFLYAQSIGVPAKAFRSKKFWTRMWGLKVSIEHLRKKADGGGMDHDNIVAACNWCNTYRGDRRPIEWFCEVQDRVKNGVHPHSALIRASSESKTG